MNNKIFIATDERSGGTTFTSLFEAFSLKTIDDPQIRLKRKENIFKNYKTKKNRTNLMLDFCYNNLNINVIKCCYAGFSINEYNELLNYCINNNIIIIILHRDNIFKRSLSLEMAKNKLGWDIFNEEKQYKKINIKIKNYLKNINQYKNKANNCINYLNNKNKKYYFVIFENFIKNKTASNLLYIQLNLNLQNEELFNKLMNKNYKTQKKINLVANIDAINNINKTIKKPIFNLANNIFNNNICTNK